jgi:hypothetical protein
MNSGRVRPAEIDVLAPLENASPADVIAQRRAARVARGEAVAPSRAVPRGVTAHG